MEKPRIAQLRHPLTNRWVKIDLGTGRILATKKSPGPYKRVLAPGLTGADAPPPGILLDRFEIRGRTTDSRREWFVTDAELPGGEFAAGPFGTLDEARDAFVRLLIKHASP